MSRFTKYTSTGFILWILSSVVLVAQDDAAVFKKYCGACHTVGGGKLVGPDLAGISNRREPEWIRNFTRKSGEMIRQGDPAALAIAAEYNNMMMPDFPGSDGELNQILMFFLSSSSGPQAGAAPDTFLLAAEGEHYTRGRRLFTGENGFRNRGPSCITCHAARNLGGIGGTLAKNLDLTYSSVKGPGIRSMLQNPAFPSMVSAYGTKPLTDQEIYDLAAFLKLNDGKTIASALPGRGTWLYFPGTGVYLLGLSLLLFLWFRRKNESVNHAIFSRQVKAEPGNPIR